MKSVEKLKDARFLREKRIPFGLQEFREHLRYSGPRFFAGQRRRSTNDQHWPYTRANLLFPIRSGVFFFAQPRDVMTSLEGGGGEAGLGGEWVEGEGVKVATAEREAQTPRRRSILDGVLQQSGKNNSNRWSRTPYHPPKKNPRRTNLTRILLPTTY